MLTHQAESYFYRRQGKALSNFSTTLPTNDSDLVQEVLKDPYNFGLLTLGEQIEERAVHPGLVAHIWDFLTDLGKGFAYVGSESRMELEGREYRLDLLFYHLHLRRYVVIELKPGEFEPEYAGKMNFYLSLVDAQLLHPTDALSIGILLCKSRNRLVVAYALRDMSKPIGVSEYSLSEGVVPSLPGSLRDSLPTVEELEAELGRGRPEEQQDDVADAEEADETEGARDLC